jgi:hypothetical protein
MWQNIRNRPLKVTYGDLRTSAERDNSIQRRSQLFVHVTQRTWEDCSNPGTNKRQPDIHHALAIVKVASEEHNDISDGVMHSTFSLVGLNEHLLTFRQFQMICDRNLSPFQMRTACRILILTRRLQHRLWTVCPRRLVSYRTKVQGCVAASIHAPDTRNELCLITRRHKPIYVFFVYFLLVCFNDCQ